MKLLAIGFCLLAISSSGVLVDGWRPSVGGWRAANTYTRNPWVPLVTTPRPKAIGDTRTLEQLHKLALAEGGRVIVYAGGDAPGQQDATKAAFEKRFPGMTLDIIVDLSKFHSPRIDYQLATGSLVPDVTQLQTLQYFPKWLKAGLLLNYRPIGWDQIYDEFKTDGSYYAVTIYAFSNFINTNLLPSRAQWPLEATDYLKPEFKGRIIATWPHDDDAVLYWFRQVIDKYGWDYMRRLLGQGVTWVRGTQGVGRAVEAGTLPVTFTTAGSLTPDGRNATFVLPQKDPFVFWPQLGAIFKGAKHPEGAKLYMSWLLDKQNQGNGFTWPVRRDFPVPQGYKSPFEYREQTDILGFGRFMADRAAVETFRTQMALFIGEVQGPSPTRTFELGTNPTVALPH